MSPVETAPGVPARDVAPLPTVIAAVKGVTGITPTPPPPNNCANAATAPVDDGPDVSRKGEAGTTSTRPTPNNAAQDHQQYNQQSMGQE